MKKGDRDIRLAEALGFSKSPDEVRSRMIALRCGCSRFSQALLKRCSHFSTDMDDETAALEGGAPDVCTSILQKREAQLEECMDEYKKKVVVAVAAHLIAEKTGLYSDGKEGQKKSDQDRPLLRHLQFVRRSRSLQVHR